MGSNPILSAIFYADMTKAPLFAGLLLFVIITTGLADVYD